MTCLAIYSSEEVMETAFERWSLKIVVHEFWKNKERWLMPLLKSLIRCVKIFMSLQLSQDTKITSQVFFKDFVFFEWLIWTHLFVCFQSHLLKCYRKVFFSQNTSFKISLWKSLLLNTLQAKGFQDQQEEFHRVPAFHIVAEWLLLYLFVLS